MKCEEIRNLLPHYLEGDLDVEVKRALDEHLRTCLSCAKELAELKEITSSLKKIPEVEPPPYFLEAVHARLEKREPLLGRILKWLFIPFYFKIPLEAVAVTATAVIIFILVQKGEIAKLGQFEREAVVGQSGTAQLYLQEEVMPFKEAHPRQMMDQMSQADFQEMSQAQSREPVLKSEINLDERQDIDYIKGAQDIVVERSLSAPEALYKSKSFTKDNLVLGDSEGALIARKESVMDTGRRGIVIESRNLDRDKAILEGLLNELNISGIESENYSDKIIFSFYIPISQSDILMAKLKENWESLTYGDSKELRQPGSIKLKVILTLKSIP